MAHSEMQKLATDAFCVAEPEDVVTFTDLRTGATLHGLVLDMSEIDMLLLVFTGTHENGDTWLSREERLVRTGDVDIKRLQDVKGVVGLLSVLAEHDADAAVRETARRIRNVVQPLMQAAE